LLSLVMAFFGTSSLLRYLGIRMSILLFPAISAVLCIMIAIQPDLMVIYYGQLILKATGYAINNPAKEILYSPTNPDVKLKVKQWIDVFGQRSAKAIGAAICEPFKYNIPGLLVWGTWIAFGFTAVWSVCAVYVGIRFNSLMQTKVQAEIITTSDDPTPSVSSSSKSTPSDLDDELDDLQLHATAIEQQEQQLQQQQQTLHLLFDDDDDDDMDNDK
jgi:hypothetical protein